MMRGGVLGRGIMGLSRRMDGREGFFYFSLSPPLLVKRIPYSTFD